MSEQLAVAVTAAYKQWHIGGVKNGTALVAGVKYNLGNTKTKKYLQYESQDWGINLGWTDDGTPATAAKVTEWTFSRKEGAAGPILYGDFLALKNARESFVYYGHRDYGINLAWSKEPVFEWRLAGGKTGKPVTAGELLAIYNEKDDECLIYFDRTVGGSIGWPTSKTWGSQLADAAYSAVKNKVKSELGLS